MNLFRCFAISFALSFAAACSSGPGTDFKVASPDGTLCVGIRAADSLTYTVTRHGTPVLQPSAIGLHFADGTVLGRGAKVTDARRETVERVVVRWRTVAFSWRPSAEKLISFISTGF